jgi:hypothetical protein
MAIDLFDLRAYTDGVEIDEFRLVHLTVAGGGPDWGLMRNDGIRLSHWLSLGAESKEDALGMIEAVGLMPLREEQPVGDEQDVIIVLQPGSARAADEPPV